MIDRLSAYTFGRLQRLWELETLCGQQQATIDCLKKKIEVLEERLRKN